MLNISMYSVALFIHISSAIALIGGSLVAPHIRTLIAETSSVAELKTALLLARRAGRFNPLLALTLLATGLYMGSLGWWRQPWFLVAFAGWWVNFLLAKLVVKRTVAAIAQAVFQKREGLSERVDWLRRSPRWTIAARLMLGVDFSLLYLMLNKPGLTGSLSVVAVAVTALMGLRAQPLQSWARRRRLAATTPASPLPSSTSVAGSGTTRTAAVPHRFLCKTSNSLR
jgi:hypothetical protein